MVQVWLNYNNNQYMVRFPVPPEAIEIESGNNNETVNIVEFGELNLLGTRRLKNFTLKGFWPSRYYSFCQYSMFMSIQDFIDHINRIKDSRQPSRLLILSDGLNLNMAVTIDGFTYGHEGGVLDLNFELELREYRFTNLPEPSSNRLLWMNHLPYTSYNSGERRYTIKEGDTLMSIARKELHSSDRWVSIRQKNKINDPLNLKVGRVITL